MWHEIMEEKGLSGTNLIDKRYDAVVHMVTAAEGAEEFYNFSNEARYEDAAGARARDHRLRQAYMGHHKYMIIDNETNNFEEKIRRSIGLVSSIVGLPTDANVFKKYLLTGNPGALPDSIRTEKITILETYLNVPSQECLEDP
jgi:hypothetical protein